MNKRGRIAFITTPNYRKNNSERIGDFIYKHFYSLCSAFEILTTGRTYEFIEDVLNRPMSEVNCSLISKDTRFPISTEEDHSRWKSGIQQGLTPLLGSIQGMIEIAYELVEGRLDAVIHLTDWDDVIGKPDSMVLRREANVHNITIASDIQTAEAAVSTWNSLLARIPEPLPIFSKQDTPTESPLAVIKPGDRVLALIAHDAMKLDICCFMVENAKTIFREFDYILATGTTGKWLRKFVLATGRAEKDAERIRCCLSGPYGGDVQIAAAVVKKLCRKVIFLQDPFSSHPHETDIRLFEQSVLLFTRASITEGIDIELATNIESAKVILGV